MTPIQQFNNSLRKIFPILLLLSSILFTIHISQSAILILISFILISFFFFNMKTFLSSQINK